MGAAKPRRRLIVNADDFGRSSAINRSVIEAHQNGVLTTASIMAGGEAFAEAVQLARENPSLGVGLHLTLCCGRPVLQPQQIPSLVTSTGAFSNSPIAAGLKYHFSARARSELSREIAAQLSRFRETGLELDHVNGHLHFHLHPVVFDILLPMARALGMRAIRLTRDPLRIDGPLGRGRAIYRLSHAIIFSALSGRAEPVLRRGGIKHTRHVFGLLENGRVHEDYLLKLIPALPPGDAEVYSHPSADARAPERFAEHRALLSPRVREALRARDIDLIRYRDL
jgi:hopanoid biosynthesis associated protein HpnK